MSANGESNSTNHVAADVIQPNLPALREVVFRLDQAIGAAHVFSKGQEVPSSPDDVLENPVCGLAVETAAYLLERSDVEGRVSVVGEHARIKTGSTIIDPTFLQFFRKLGITPIEAEALDPRFSSSGLLVVEAGSARDHAVAALDVAEKALDIDATEPRIKVIRSRERHVDFLTRAWGSDDDMSRSPNDVAKPIIRHLLERVQSGSTVI